MLSRYSYASKNNDNYDGGLIVSRTMKKTNFLYSNSILENCFTL